MRGKGQSLDALDYEKSNGLLSDVILNFKTCFSFGTTSIDNIIDRFEDLLRAPIEKKIKAAHYSGILFGYSQASRTIFLGLVFKIAVWIITTNPQLETQNVFTAIYVLFMSSYGIGSNLSNIPSITRAKESAKNVFDIIDEKSNLDVRKSHPDQKTTIEKCEISFNNVSFKYPTRDAIVLEKFKMHIPANAKIALVGHSGCGKSTITNLLLRFYDTMSGQITIDGIDIRNYNVMQLRKQIGFVQQEPLLFDQTIKENILYGNDQASDAEVYRCADLANALTFIESDIEKMEKNERLRKYREMLIE